MEKAVNIAAGAEEPRLQYDRKGAARQLSVSIRTLDYLIKRRQIATRRIGKKKVIPRSELQRFIKADHFGPVATGLTNLI